MKAFLEYWFWPNPSGWAYADQKIVTSLLLAAGLIVLSFVLRFLRAQMKNPVTKKLSTSWPRAAFWFGLVALILIVSRVEHIQFVAMRVLWILWLLFLALYLLFQLFQFRRRHYTVIERKQVIDERDKYLPRKKA